jgi:uncharacterized OsmC-like protein
MDTIKNGINLSNIEGLIGGINEDPGLAEVQFQARSVWKGGTQAEVSIGPMIAGGNDIADASRRYTVMVDEPSVLGGADEYPNPVEYLASALCGCITAGIATNASLFDVDVDKIEVDVDVNFNIKGVLGLDRSFPNGPLDLHYKVRLGGPGAAEYLAKSKETIDRKSPIKNTIELPLTVTTEMEIEES